MQKTENFVPADATQILVAVDKIKFREPQGFWASPYCKEKNSFSSFVELVMEIDKFYNKCGFLQQTMQLRSFEKKRGKNSLKRWEVIRYMSDKMFQEEKGDKSTFVIQVLFRQNTTWQGKIKWVEGGEETMFRSTLELLKLMDGAITRQDEKLKEIN